MQIKATHPGNNSKEFAVDSDKSGFDGRRFTLPLLIEREADSYKSSHRPVRWVHITLLPVRAHVAEVASSGTEFGSFSLVYKAGSCKLTGAQPVRCAEGRLSRSKDKHGPKLCAQRALRLLLGSFHISKALLSVQPVAGRSSMACKELLPL